MKIDYNVLWIEDDQSWYDTTLELFKGNLEEEGFELKSDRKDNIQQIRDLIHVNGLKKFDMLLIDFKLKNSDSGDEIIKLIRDNNIYTDVLFYSSAVENIKESISKHGLEGVYTTDRKDIETKFNAVFSTTIKKIQEVNTMRGLIIGETSDLDIEIEYLVMVLIEKQRKTEEELKKIIKEKEYDKLENRLKTFWKKYDNFQNYFSKLDAIKKWEILRDLLKPLKNEKEIDDFLITNKTYQNEVIEVRNIFAHVKAEEECGKTILKGKNNIEFDEEKCVEIRKNINKHKKNLDELKKTILKFLK